MAKGMTVAEGAVDAIRSKRMRQEESSAMVVRIHHYIFLL